MIKRTYEKFNESVYIIKLKNGMQVHVLADDNPGFSTFVEISIPYGANGLNYKVGEQVFSSPYGTAHFFEHKIFAMPEGDASAYLSKLGVDDNAWTSYSQTSYHFSATNNVFEALTYLLKMLDNTYFSKENIKKEKDIIEQEIKMYADDPYSEMERQLYEMMYHNHPVRYDILGTISSINDIDEKVLDDVYKAFYNPSNRLVVISGKINLKQIQKYFKDYDFNNPIKHQRPTIIIPKEPKKLVSKKQVEKKMIGIDKLMLGIKINSKSNLKKDKVKEELALSILLNMLLGTSSKMYENLIEQTLINHSFYVELNHEKGASNIIVYAETKKSNKLKKILTDLFVSQGLEYLNQVEFEKTKKVFIGNYIYELNNLEVKTYYYGKYFHKGLSLYESIDYLTSIDYQDVINSYHWLQNRHIASLIYKKTK